MRRMIGVALLVLTVARVVGAQQLNQQPQSGEHDWSSVVLLRSGYFLPSDSAFKDIYGGGSVYGAEIRIGGPRLAGGRVAGWVEGNYRKRTGAFSFTREETKVRVTAVEGGMLYKITASRVSPYAGAGIGYYMFEEKNDPLGKASQNKVGACGVAGVSVSAAKRLAFDFRLKYSTSKMQPADFKIDVGGVAFDLGVGLRF